MSASVLLRSAGRAARRSITQGPFRRSPVRSLSGGVGRFEPNQQSPSKPNMGNTQRFEYGNRVCRAAERQKEWDEFASELRVLGDKIRVLEQTYREADKWDNKREKVLVCASALIAACCVFAPGGKSVENQVM